MENLTQSKLIDLVKLLTPKEWKDLAYWLNAPWTKKEARLITFYQLLAKHYPSFKAKNLNKEKLYQELFQNTAYDNLKLNHLIRKFTEEVEAFLAHLKLLKDKTVQQNTLRIFLLERQQIKRFEETSEALLKQIETKSAKSANDFLVLYQINRDLYFQPSAHRRYEPNGTELDNAHRALNEFFLLETYKYLHEQVTRSKILDKPTCTIPKELQEFLAYLRKNHISMPAALYEFKLQQKAMNWQAYLEFKALFEATHQQLPSSLQQVFLFGCINDAVAFVSKGQDIGLAELYYWYQLGIEKHLLSQYNTITGITFNNVILTACHFDDVALIQHFIKTYQNKLPANLQKEAKRWALAHLTYVMGDYNACIIQLENKLPKQPVYSIQAKLTLLKAHFKWVLADATQGSRFHYYCLSFEQYLNRNSPYSTDRSQSILRYIQFIKKIAKLNQETSKQEGKEKLLQSIQNTSNLFGKTWLKKELTLLVD